MIVTTRIKNSTLNLHSERKTLKSTEILYVFSTRSKLHTRVKLQYDIRNHKYLTTKTHHEKDINCNSIAEYRTKTWASLELIIWINRQFQPKIGTCFTLALNWKKLHLLLVFFKFNNFIHRSVFISISDHISFILAPESVNGLRCGSRFSQTLAVKLRMRWKYHTEGEFCYSTHRISHKRLEFNSIQVKLSNTIPRFFL